MRITTWNVNSLRARLEHVARFSREAAPDVLCLQELKLVDDLFPVDVLAERTGLLLGMRARAFVTQGDGFAFVGESITREALLAELDARPAGGGAEVAT